MSAESTLLLRVTRRFRASAERVFDAWLDPARAGRWLFATPGGEMVRVEIDARVGGRFHVVERRGGEDAEHLGEYLEIDRPRRLVFTFATEHDSDDVGRVTVEIVPLDAGCELTLTHEMDARWEAYADRTRDGWAGIVAGLAAALAEPEESSAGSAG